MKTQVAFASEAWRQRASQLDSSKLRACDCTLGRIIRIFLNPNQCGVRAVGCQCPRCGLVELRILVSELAANQEWHRRGYSYCERINATERA